MRLLSLVAAVCGFLAFSVEAEARLPRDAVLLADDLQGDPDTGTTIARGRAELHVAPLRIHGQAEMIEVLPVRNEVHFMGNAHLEVGSDRYAGESIVCTLDFYSCRAAPASPAPEQAGGYPRALPAPSALGAVETKPR